MKNFRLLAAVLFASTLATLAPAQDSSEFAALRAKAEKGNGIAQYNLGLAYAEGKGVAVDRLEAFVWLSLARQNGARGRALDNLVASFDKATFEAAQQRLAERTKGAPVAKEPAVTPTKPQPVAKPVSTPPAPPRNLSPNRARPRPSRRRPRPRDRMPPRSSSRSPPSARTKTTEQRTGPGLEGYRQPEGRSRPGQGPAVARCRPPAPGTR